VAAVAVVALGISLAFVPRLGHQNFCRAERRHVVVEYQFAARHFRAGTMKQCARMRAALRTVPEVGTVVSKAGRPEDGTDPAD